MSQESQSQDWLTRQINDFETAWQEFETPPEIADFLPSASADPAVRSRLLVDLVMIDLDYRWRQSSSRDLSDVVPPNDPAITIAHQPSTTSKAALPNRPLLEDYVERYPELGSLAGLPDELVAYEFRVRRLWGDRPTADSYRERFGPGRGALWAQLDEMVREIETAGHDRSLTSTQRPLEPRALKIRCPHCHNPVEILDEQALGEISCPSCQTVFSLVGRQESTSSGAQTPRKFGHFELIEQVGEGAFGAVWKACDTQLERTVAVKIPRRTQLNAEDIEKFIREARAAAQLKHPNIVSVHEVGREHDTVYIVSDFIEGQSLDKSLAGQPRTPTEAATLCLKIADALHHAHEAGIVHRDLKPSNIMIDAAGEPHVMDFGLAKREAGEITMTVEGQILGTPAYMSPEQAKGEGHAADRRSDAYSLGVILFELLTGERPFRGNVRMLLQQVLEDTPPSPRKLDARIPKDLETITLKCLEKDADRRYATTADLSQELTRFIEHKPILARPISRTERAWRWCKRNPTIAGLTSAVFLVLLVGLAGVFLFAIDARRQLALKDAALLQLGAEQSRADDGKRRGSVALDLCVAFSPDGQQFVSGSFDATLKLRELPSGQVTLMLKGHTDAVSGVAFSPDGERILSGSYDKTLKIWDAATGRETMTLTGHNSRVMGVAFSPDGKRIVSGSDDKTLKVWDASSGAEIMTLRRHNGRVSSVAYSPDSKRIVSGSDDRTLKVWDATSGVEIMTLRGHDGRVSSVAYSPDGKRIVSGSDDKTLKVWDATSGAETVALKGHTKEVLNVAISPDGKQIVSGSLDATLNVWDVVTSQKTLTLKGYNSICSVAFSRDGKQIVSSRGKSLIVWDTTSGAEILTLKGHNGEVSSVAFSPDGHRIVTGSYDATLKVWDATIYAEALLLNEHERNVTSVAFSPDGKRIVSGSEDTTLKVWDAASGNDLLTLKGHNDIVSSVAYSPDGKQIASGSHDQTLKIWDANRGRQTMTLKGHNGRVNSVEFSPDGKRIVSGSDDKTLKIWDASSGNELLTLKGHNGRVSSVAYSRDGKQIVSGSDDKTIGIWNATNGVETMTLKGHADVVRSVAFSPDGKQIVSASRDQTLKVWDATSGAEIQTLNGHTSEVLSVAVSPGGKRIASGAFNGMLKIWDTSHGEETTYVGTVKTWGSSNGEETNRPGIATEETKEKEAPTQSRLDEDDPFSSHDGEIKNGRVGAQPK